MGYALKLGDQVFPLTRMIDPDDLLDNSKNTIVYEQDEQLKLQVKKFGESLADQYIGIWNSLTIDFSKGYGLR